MVDRWPLPAPGGAYEGLKGWLLWNGPVRFMFWRWRASEADRRRLKQRVRELERGR